MTDLALASELQTALANFTGTSQYHRIHSNTLLTDGAYYLAETAACYWLMDLYASHLASVDPNIESFTCLKLTKRGLGAEILIEDGNTHALAKQQIEYTDFQLESFMFYAVWAGDFWVLMLRSEY